MSYEKEQVLQAEIRQMLEKEAEDVNTRTALQGIDSPVEVEESDTVKQARTIGWKTKEERLAEGKDNTHYVEADEYLRRQPLFNRMDEQKKEIKELRDLVKQSTQHLTTVRKESYNQAFRDLEQKRLYAVETGNIDDFRVFDSQAKQLTDQMQQDPMIVAPVIEQQKPEEIVSFEKKNESWYNQNTPENTKMYVIARATDDALAKIAQIEGRQLNVKDHLAAVEAEVKRVFPHRFEKKTPVSMVGTSTTSRRSDSTSDLVSRLSSQQRDLGLKFYKSNKDYTLEKYAEDLNLMGRLGK